MFWRWFWCSTARLNNLNLPSALPFAHHTQVIDGLQFAFPTYMTSLQKSGKFPSIFALKQQIADEEHIKAYLDSERRKEYSMGLYRRYEELDGEFKE